MPNIWRVIVSAKWTRSGKPWAMGWFALSAIQGHEPTWENLCFYADKLSNSFAIFEMRQVHHARGDYKNAAQCIERVLSEPALALLKTLNKGIIYELRGDYFRPLKLSH